MRRLTKVTMKSNKRAAVKDTKKVILKKAAAKMVILKKAAAKMGHLKFVRKFECTAVKNGKNVKFYVKHDAKEMSLKMNVKRLSKSTAKAISKCKAKADVVIRVFILANKVKSASSKARFVAKKSGKTADFIATDKKYTV
jgi:hypothetical protein